MEHICKTCMWWCGTEADTNAFCDEKEVQTSAGTYCPKWLKQPDDDLTEVHRQELIKLLKNEQRILVTSVMSKLSNIKQSPSPDYFTYILYIRKEAGP